MQSGIFPHVLFHLLSTCVWISLLFAVKILPILVRIHSFIDLYLKKSSEMHWFFWFYKTFSAHENNILATLVAAWLFPDAVPDFWFSFHSCSWCDFWLCDILPNLKQHVGVLVLILKSSVCWRSQCWRYSLYMCIYRIPYSENSLIHFSPHVRNLVCTGLQ